MVLEKEAWFVPLSPRDLPQPTSPDLPPAGSSQTAVIIYKHHKSSVRPGRYTSTAYPVGCSSLLLGDGWLNPSDTRAQTSNPGKSNSLPSHPALVSVSTQHSSP